MKIGNGLSKIPIGACILSSSILGCYYGSCRRLGLIVDYTDVDRVITLRCYWLSMWISKALLFFTNNTKIWDSK